MSHTEILSSLNEKFGSGIFETDITADIPTVIVDVSIILGLISYLKNEFGFEFLTDLCGIHYPDREKSLGVVYHLHNMRENLMIRVKTFVSDSNPEVPTLTPVFSAANWMERETYDFYGIIFTGHPNLKRILNVEYLDFFPLRKQYPLEDPTRKDKDDRYFGR